MATATAARSTSGARHTATVALAVAAIVSISAALALTVLAATSCSGGYACPPVAAPPGSFSSEIASGTASSTADTTIAGTAGGSSYTLLVPRGVLPNGTTVDILGGNPSTLGSYLPAGQGYIDSAAVGWQAPDGSAPAATSALVLTVTNAQVSSADSLYLTTSKGLTSGTGMTASAHQWSASFTNDPGFVVAGAGVTTPTTGGGHLNSSFLVAGILVLMGIALLVARRRLSVDA